MHIMMKVAANLIVFNYKLLDQARMQRPVSRASESSELPAQCSHTGVRARPSQQYLPMARRASLQWTTRRLGLSPPRPARPGGRMYAPSYTGATIL